MDTTETGHQTTVVVRPVGKENVIRAALEAAADLFADNNYSQVTVREIARRAGVSHALVHRYLGYKEDIFRAVLEWERKHAVEYWAQVTDVRELSSPAMTGYRVDRYLKTVLRAHIEGLPVQIGEEDLEAPRQLLAIIDRSGHRDAPIEPKVDARYLVMMVSAARAAYSLAPEFFRSIAQLEAEDPAEVTDEYDRVLGRVLTMPHTQTH